MLWILTTQLRQLHQPQKKMEKSHQRRNLCYMEGVSPRVCKQKNRIRQSVPQFSTRWGQNYFKINFHPTSSGLIVSHSQARYWSCKLMCMFRGCKALIYSTKQNWEEKRLNHLWVASTLPWTGRMKFIFYAMKVFTPDFHLSRSLRDSDSVKNI